MPKQFRLKGASLQAIREKAEAQYGAGARIVAAEKVTNPGIAGLFAANRFEATVEVPDSVPAAPVESTAAAPGPVPAHPGLHRPAIAALLEQADASELHLHGGGAAASLAAGPAAPGNAAVPVSTARPDFAGLLEQLGNEYGSLPPAVEHSLGHKVAGPPKVPAPLTGAGDLVLLLGLGDDALGPALEMSMAAGGCDVRTAGSVTAFGHLHVPDRQGATAARAGAVAAGQSVLLAFGLGRPRDVAGHSALIPSLGADQVWAVVDARRKPEDTEAWLKVLREKVPVDALAVVGAEDTLSPGTVDALGLPVGWQDGRKVH